MSGVFVAKGQGKALKQLVRMDLKMGMDNIFVLPETCLVGPGHPVSLPELLLLAHLLMRSYEEGDPKSLLLMVLLGAQNGGFCSIVSIKVLAYWSSLTIIKSMGRSLSPSLLT